MHKLSLQIIEPVKKKDQLRGSSESVQVYVKFNNVWFLPTEEATNRNRP